MNLWRFLRAESQINGLKLIVITALAGLSNALLMVIINFGARSASSGSGSRNSVPQWPSGLLFLIFIAVLIAYVLSQRTMLAITNTEVEGMIGRLRARLGDKIRRAELQAIEELGQTYIFTVTTRDTQTISQTASPAVIALQSAIMVFFTAIYIAFLNFFAFVLTLAILAMAILLHFRQRERLAEDLQNSTAKENEVFLLLTDILEGFKEVKLNTYRSNELNETLARATAVVVELKTKTAVLFAENFVFSQTVFYVLLGAVVFVLPRLMGAKYVAAMSDFTDAILFIIGPLSNLIGTLPLFSAADVAVNNIANLEVRLDEMQRASKDGGEDRFSPPEDFRAIRLIDVTFEYHDHGSTPTFRLGPVNLTIGKQKILFIVGGNGSGKSTLLKLLTALYYPHSGAIELDGKDIANLGYASYRNLFSTVFSDYHLFDRLYGLKASEEEVTEMLNYMELVDKTKFVDGSFSSQELSTGQRKRLALIVSILEDRPILVLDEWAADQDPVFRKKFYTEILPELRSKKNKTIIAATHDDRYFDVADEVWKMESGSLSILRAPSRATVQR